MTKTAHLVDATGRQKTDADTNSRAMPRPDYIIHIHLHGGGDYYFGCVKAIYTLLDDEQVGCRLPDIYKHGLPYSTEKATIQRGEVVRMPQNKEK